MLPLSARPPKIFALGLVFAIAAFFVFMIIIPNYVEAQTSPTLGTAASFAVLAGSTGHRYGNQRRQWRSGCGPRK